MGFNSAFKGLNCQTPKVDESLLKLRLDEGLMLK